MRVPRLLLFYGLVALMLAVLTGGLAYRQLFRSSVYSERERLQNQRRIIAPGPRGNILDREGRVLVGNRPRFSVVLNLAELRGEFRTEYRQLANRYRDLARSARPSSAQLERTARAAVAQRYLDQVNAILGRQDRIAEADIHRHFNQTLLLPFVLLDNLAPEEYARLIERLPVVSPLQVYASSSRYYPYENAAAHVLGYVGTDNAPALEDAPGEDLMTFTMRGGTIGREGLELKFDGQLQGQAGYAIYRVDPAGYKVGRPIEKKLPVQGQDIHTSIDIDLQLAAEKAMAGHVGAAVALDIKTGEVLLMASKPDFDPLTRKPILAPDQDLEKSGVWMNRATQGRYPPGSTFKIITAIAGLRAGAIDPHETHLTCPGYYMVGARSFPCHNHSGHGDVDLRKAIAQSCNVFFYKIGLEIGPDLVATEAERFGFGEPTGIELPAEAAAGFGPFVVARPKWKQDNIKERWYPGDTANTAIGQGFTLVSPLQAACMVASFARGETRTRPTLLHDVNHQPQHTTPLNMLADDYETLRMGMAEGYAFGTGKLARVEGLTAGTKSGTAQTMNNRKELAWIVAFAPFENPEIAVAVMLEGEVGVRFGGGMYAGPVTKAILEAWKQKRDRAPATNIRLAGSE